jgi:predicted GNAT superfamily acetyltransferase
MPAIRLAQPADLPAAAALLAKTLGFMDRDAIPAWLMRTTDECGGLTLVADCAGAVVGASYAFPASDGVLFSCGLAVAPAHRGHGLGAALKAAQRREAIALGYSCVRWTTDPLNGRALRLYLSHLGALITGYRPGFHDDDVEIVWQLANGPAVDRGAVPSVELPWSEGGVADRRRVHAEMSVLLADGYVGCGVALDPRARRCHVEFARLLR